MTVRIKSAHSILLLLLVASPVLAAKNPRPIYIESDRLQVEEKKGISHFNGHVKFKQGDLVIYAESIRARETQGEVNSVLIQGSPIKLNQDSAGKPPITARANKIEYFADSEMVHLYGDAMLQQGSQQFQGEHIQYNIRSQEVIADGNQQTMDSNGQGRVKAVIMPKNNTEPGNK